MGLPMATRSVPCTTRATVDQIVGGRLVVPPLTHRLVGRRPGPGMSIAHARLCLAYCGAVTLRRGTVGLDDFVPAALADPDTLALADRLMVIADGNPDPNALLPQRVELDLADGRTIACDIAEVLGSPARPLSPEATRAKFAQCVVDLPQGDALWDAVTGLEAQQHSGALARLAAP